MENSKEFSFHLAAVTENQHLFALDCVVSGLDSIISGNDKMSRLKYSRLCCLVHDSLTRFTTKSMVSMTKEQEKSLLISLSQVLNKIKLWTGEFDSDSASDSGNSDHSNPLIPISLCHSSVSECILKITHDLVLLLAVESCYVQHLAENVLVSMSDFVVASGSYWEEFMQSICYYFELLVPKVISPSSDPPMRAKHLDCDSSNFKLDFQSVLNNAGWHSVGAIVLVLRTILKQLKHEDDVKIMDIYLHVLGSCLQTIPWDLCDRVSIAEINTQPVSWFEFCGYLVQLFCSLADYEEENPAIHEIFNIFPKILTWCFGKQGENCNYTCISQYIRHKILVLMIRLSSVVDLDCEMVVSWLRLIDTYFQDLLFSSITQPQPGADQDDCLNESPFNGTCNRHLQRRVVFLYLRCAFSLISLKERYKEQCLCGDVKSCSKKGFTALYEWLKKQLPANILVNSELYDDSCKSFTKSFIQLYMYEDDTLFEVLLQLTYTPFGSTKQIPDDWAFHVVEKDTTFMLSHIFDSVRLFHLFLSELHYDHQVLLDYLISKDTGASCAEYLLRCFRIICNKWNSFVEFSLHVEVGTQGFYKRRKFMNELESATDKILSSSNTNHQNEKPCKQPFYNARDCLLSLKKSIENLHLKDLFPYNPEVLLRRLTRFEELCLRQ